MAVAFEDTWLTPGSNENDLAAQYAEEQYQKGGGGRPSTVGGRPVSYDPVTGRAYYTDVGEGGSTAAGGAAGGGGGGASVSGGTSSGGGGGGAVSMGSGGASGLAGNRYRIPSGQSNDERDRFIAETLGRGESALQAGLAQHQSDLDSVRSRAAEAAAAYENDPLAESTRSYLLRAFSGDIDTSIADTYSARLRTAQATRGLSAGQAAARDEAALLTQISVQQKQALLPTALEQAEKNASRQLTYEQAYSQMANNSAAARSGLYSSLAGLYSGAMGAFAGETEREYETLRLFA